MTYLHPGPDPDFPYLEADKYFAFPNPKEWKDNIIAVGGNLSPGILLSAYEQGIFPWYNPGDPVIWQSPDPRLVLFPEKLHISASMKKVINQKKFEITIDKDFHAVIKSCAETIRPNQNGSEAKPATWITEDIVDAYTELHRFGWAHSAEAWQDGKLAGGCYGILMGRGFFGESMFAKESNASKAAFITFARILFNSGLKFIDCQTPSEHLISLGAEEMPRKDFLKLLKKHRISR